MIPLDQRIEDAAVLAGVVLILLPVFTATRESTLIALRNDAKATKADAERQILLTAVVAGVTVLIFFAGLPLWLDVICNLSPTTGAGVTRSLFAIAWLLLLGLVGWHTSLISRACTLRGELDE